MKHLKPYENNNQKYFWKVKVKAPFLEASLIKLNFSKIQITNFLNNENKNTETYVYVASRNTISYKNEEHLSWAHGNDYGYTTFIRENFTYGGEIKLTRKEADLILQQIKYNL